MSRTVHHPHNMLAVIVGIIVLGVGNAACHATTCDKIYQASTVALVIQDGVVVPVDQQEINGNAVANASFIDSDQTLSNFGQLHVHTSSAFSDAQQMYAAGWAEGWLTAHRIFQQVHNTMHYFKTSLGLKDDKPVDWLEEQDAWVRQQVDANPDDQFWRALGLVLKQFDGLVDGYRARVSSEGPAASHVYGNLTKRDLLFMNGNGELYDVLAKPRNITEPGNTADGLLRFNPHSAASFDDPSLSPGALFTRLAGSGKCSALIKVASDLSNLYMAHSTWDTFTAMLRIFKHYHLNLNDEMVAAKHIAFSSYPGELFSDDDFYMMAESRMVVLQTTNHIFNNSILDILTPRSAVSWQRVRVANMLAANGSAWADLLAREQSGTYNNQYMVVDLKRFVPHKELQDNLLWVVEQIPGNVVAADMTHALWLGYWPSFNVPYFKEIYEASAYPDFANKTHRRGGTEYDMPVNWLSPVISPRAMIFRRDQGEVASLEDFKSLMRYNDYQHDKLSGGHPLASICGRGDLESEGGYPTGCYDTKVTDFQMALSMKAEVVNGPTRSHGMAPFSWSDWPQGKYMHHGHPDVFDFEFERIGPSARDARCARAAERHPAKFELA